MSLIGRYTIRKYKTFCLDLVDNALFFLSRIYALCNENNKTRLVSLGCILFLFFVFGWLFSLLKPKPALPKAQKLVLSKTDAQGDKWTIDYSKNQDIQALLNNDKKTGPPLTLKFKFHRESRFLYILPELFGVAGEKYFPGILKNGKWQPPPMLVIATPEGRLLHRGQFEYG